jgi:hypothetical protein
VVMRNRDRFDIRFGALVVGVGRRQTMLDRGLLALSPTAERESGTERSGSCGNKKFPSIHDFSFAGK